MMMIMIMSAYYAHSSSCLRCSLQNNILHYLHHTYRSIKWPVYVYVYINKLMLSLMCNDGANCCRFKQQFQPELFYILNQVYAQEYLYYRLYSVECRHTHSHKRKMIIIYSLCLFSTTK